METLTSKTQERATLRAQSAVHQPQATIVPSGRGKDLKVFGIGIEILLTGEQTRDDFSAYLVHAEPGYAPPPHLHQNEDETFYVLAGKFEVLCGEQISTVSTGAIVTLPRQVAHTFRNIGTTTGHLLGFSTPAGHDKFFEDASRVSFPPTAEEVVAVCERHGMVVTAP